MTLVQRFDLYQYSESGIDEGGSPTHSVVKVYEDATGTFVTPGSTEMRDWFGEDADFTFGLIVRHNLANAPLYGISVFAYLDIDEYPFLYIIPKDPLGVYYGQVFNVKRITKSPRPGVYETVVVGLTRLGTDERVELRDGVLVSVSG